MKTEFEVKFINVDFSLMRRQLKKIGATQTHKMRIMRRAIIDNPEMKQKNAFLRVRDEGDKITLTYKQFNDLSVDGAKEYEINVNDFQATIDLLKAAGLPYRSFQESKRETWKLDGAEIVLDEWPWLNPYIEIEGHNENHVRKTSEKLGFNWVDAVFGDVMTAYRAQYPHLTDKDTVGNIIEVRFNDPLPSLLKA
jgi:adenylate cyclase, class 2